MRSNIACTCPSGRVPVRAPVLTGAPDGSAQPVLLFSEDRKLTSALSFCGGKFLNDGIGAVGFCSVRMIAALGSLSAIVVRWGPGPSLPFSPILWQARQPDWAATSLPASYCGTTFMSIVFGEPAAAPW